jgi:hypothetical protein
MSLNLRITNVKNANDLDSFVPVEGRWVFDGLSDDGLKMEDVEESVRNYMDADYPITVQVFAANGHAITGDMPSSGTFISTRK